MNSSYAASPFALVRSAVEHRDLIGDLVRREFIGRYRGSILGVGWALFSPLLMLAIYTFVFSVAFNARWGAGDESKATFALVLFSGMIVHAFFSECLTRAPGLIVTQPNFVKKVLFPLEILAWVTVFSAALHFVVSFLILMVFCMVVGVTVHPLTMLVPVALLPLFALTLGLTWILAAFGVYLRDLSQAMGMVTTIALFLAPVFYPISALPEGFQRMISWNPLTFPITQLRDLMLWGKPMLWEQWAMHLLIGTAFCFVGFWWFQKTRRGFADVL